MNETELKSWEEFEAEYQKRHKENLKKQAGFGVAIYRALQHVLPF